MKKKNLTMGKSFSEISIQEIGTSRNLLILIFSLLYFLLSISLFVANSFSGDTYYMSPAGNDINNGSEGAPWATFAKAFSTMSGGDTLILENGTYTQSMTGIRSGLDANTYTIVKARNYHQVTIDGEGIRIPIEILDDRQFIQIEGIRAINSSSHCLKILRTGQVIGPQADSPRNILIKVCAFGMAGSYKYDYTVSIGDSKDIILEDVWCWGRGRYGILAHESERITIRRAVIRFDEGDYAGQPVAGVAIYSTNDAIVENVIVLDQNPTINAPNQAGFNMPGHTRNSTNNKWLGSIALNLPSGAAGFSFSPGPEAAAQADNISTENCIAWDVGGFGYIIRRRATGLDVQHSTIGNSNGDGIFKGSIDGAGDEPVIENTLIMNSGAWGIKVNGTLKENDYNQFFNNTSGNIKGGVSLGANSITTDPQMKYIIRREIGTSGKDAANDGGDIGANILKRYKDGVLTNDNLWPWPYEDWIREDMRAVSTRGFCADGMTLTNYIWRYLGNTVPPFNLRIISKK